ncbi:MAG: hypothetical protein AAB305_02385 [Candidatus Zixiibacteriota bacterium]
MSIQIGNEQKPLHSFVSLAISAVVVVTLLVAYGCKKKPTDPPPPEPPPAKAVNIEAVNGLYYHAVMGSDSTYPATSLRIVDANSTVILNQWIQLQILEGDSALQSDSVFTGAAGLARLRYTFNGPKGHAVIRALAPLGVDTVDVVLRANTIIPGDDGQGQYVRLTDNYKTVKALIGLPDAIATIPGALIADYELSQGVVIFMYDSKGTGRFYDTSSVAMIVLSTEQFPYAGKTRDSIGIGSSISDLRAIYGTADTIHYYTDPPQLPAIIVEYRTPWIVFWCSTQDTIVEQIDLRETTNTSPSGKLVAQAIRQWRGRSNAHTP